MRGFTTIRDMGGPSFGLKRAIDEEVLPGPRIYPSGAMITVTGGHGDFRQLSDLPRTVGGMLSRVEQIGGSMIADSPDEVRLRAREQLMQGASQIKLTAGGGVASPFSPLDVSTFTEPELRAAVEAAENWGTYVATHAYTPVAIQRSIAAGVKCIEHGQLIDEPTAKLLADKGIRWSLQPLLDDEDVEDLEEAPEHEMEAAAEEVLDQATAARTIDELKAEIATLGRLEALAGTVRRSGEDRKWRELSGLLSVIFTPAAIVNQVAEEPTPYGAGAIPPPTPSLHQKLVVFTEHRDTLSYLDTRVSTLLGRKEAVVVIHGGMGREERLKAQESFRHDPDVQVLLATDAAGNVLEIIWPALAGLPAGPPKLRLELVSWSSWVQTGRTVDVAMEFNVQGADGSTATFDVRANRIPVPVAR